MLRPEMVADLARDFFPLRRASPRCEVTAITSFAEPEAQNKLPTWQFSVAQAAASPEGLALVRCED
jgi:hypothetical protein